MGRRAASIRHRLEAEFRHGWLGQISRFGIAGGFVTAIHLAVYWITATPLGVRPLIANVLAQIVSVSLGYVIHSRWSFRNFGSRERQMRTISRYVTVNALGFALNSFWVGLFTGLLDGPTWWPMPAIGLVTPLIAFWLNRQWVFKGS